MTGDENIALPVLYDYFCVPSDDIAYILQSHEPTYTKLSTPIATEEYMMQFPVQYDHFKMPIEDKVYKL